MNYRSNDYEFDQINDALRLRGARALCDWLGVTCVKSGNYLFVQPGPMSPAMGKDSFAIDANKGTFKDYRSGQHGDFIGLIALCFNISQGEAIKRARGFLGLAEEVKATPEEFAARRAEWIKQKQALEQRQAEEKAKKIKQAKAGFLSCKDAAGTIVEIYLSKVRCIDFEPMGGVPGSLRFEANSRLWCEETQGAVSHPAMVACFMTIKGEITGLHKTYLRPDGMGKADVPKAKKMYGIKNGSFIPIHKGETGLSLAEATRRNKSSLLAITEGIEDALTIAMHYPQWRVWAAGDKGNMAALPWPDCASAVVLIADNDGHNPHEREASFAPVHFAWTQKAKGRSIHIKRSERGKDFNDWLMAEMKGQS